MVCSNLEGSIADFVGNGFIMTVLTYSTVHIMACVQHFILPP